MNATDPEQIENNQRQIASHFYPSIGPYDSSDPHVIEYHLLTMKATGIDGVIVDWYGLESFLDYAQLHRNTEQLIVQAERLNMQFVICYEDQTIKALIDANKLQPKDRVAHAATEIRWLNENWFTKKGYVKLNGKPVLLSFGYSGLSDDEWTQCLQTINIPVAYFSEHRPRKSAVGAFDWPNPKEGIAAVSRFHSESPKWDQRIPVVFPGFKDYYAQAKLHDSYGTIAEDNGSTFKETLSMAIASKPSIIQIATWNDFGEGTNIEPSRERKDRDLIEIQQRCRSQLKVNFQAQPQHIRLPIQLLQSRRSNSSPEHQERIDKIAIAFSQGNFDQATAEFKALSKP